MCSPPSIPGVVFRSGSISPLSPLAASPVRQRSWLTTQVGPFDWRALLASSDGRGAAALGAVCFGLVGDRAWLSRAARRTDGALAHQANTIAVKPAAGRTWTVRQALRTPQFAILAAAYFGHLLAGALVGGLSVAQLSQRGVAIGVALGMLSLEAAMQTGGRAVAALLGDRLDARALLIFAMAVRCPANAHHLPPPPACSASPTPIRL